MSAEPTDREKLYYLKRELGAIMSDAGDILLELRDIGERQVKLRANFDELIARGKDFEAQIKALSRKYGVTLQ